MSFLKSQRASTCSFIPLLLWLLVTGSEGGSLRGTNLLLRGPSRLSAEKSAEGADRVKRDVDDEEAKPIIKSLYLRGDIVRRYSVVDVECVIENPADTDREAEFTFQLPETAFISNFTMLINGELFVAEIKGKEEAQEAYDAAKEQDQTAGQVSARPRDLATAAREMEIFSVAVNVAPNSDVVFRLVYEERLTMRHSTFQQRVSMRTGQVVENLLMELSIYEPAGITQLSTTGPEEEGVTSRYVYVTRESDVTAKVTYAPSIMSQRAMDPRKGIEGDLIIKYDVNHPNGMGDITVEGDYVLHSFSPKDLTALPKNIVFNIDVSGSMSGRKIEQTRDAMLTILDQLREDDMFMIVLFESRLRYWPTVNDEYEGEMVGPVETVTVPDPPREIVPPRPLPQPLPAPMPVPYPGRPMPRPLPSVPLQVPTPVPSPAPGGQRGLPGSQAGTPVPSPAPGGQRGLPGSLGGSSSSAGGSRGKRAVSSSGWSPIPSRTPYPPPVPPPSPVTRESRSTTGMVRATKRNIEFAKRYAAAQIRARGGTNINSALLEACRILKAQHRQKGNLVLFLTDGAPTAGVTDPETIVAGVADAAQPTETTGQISVFSLAFGFSLNYDLLEMVSLSTEGRVKRIYAEGDAGDQLKYFYQEISTPLMYDLTFTPDLNIIDAKTITRNKFPTYFQGSELFMAYQVRPELMGIVVVNEQEGDQGRKKRGAEPPMPPKMPIIFCGVGMKGFRDEPLEENVVIEIDTTIEISQDDAKSREIDCLHSDDPQYDVITNSTWIPSNSAERQWANMKIKDLLEISEVAKNKTKRAQAEKSAICLALKYHLVTPVTSLLIVHEAPERRGGEGERGRAGPGPTAQRAPTGLSSPAGPSGGAGGSYVPQSLAGAGAGAGFGGGGGGAGGQQGTPGQRGPVGPWGPAGPQGQSGQPRPSGQQGPSGQVGPSGRPGPSGLPGSPNPPPQAMTQRPRRTTTTTTTTKTPIPTTTTETTTTTTTPRPTTTTTTTPRPTTTTTTTPRPTSTTTTTPRPTTTTTTTPRPTTTTATTPRPTTTTTTTSRPTTTTKTTTTPRPTTTTETTTSRLTTTTTTTTPRPTTTTETTTTTKNPSTTEQMTPSSATTTTQKMFTTSTTTTTTMVPESTTTTEKTTRKTDSATTTTTTTAPTPTPDRAGQEPSVFRCKGYRCNLPPEGGDVQTGNKTGNAVDTIQIRKTNDTDDTSNDVINEILLGDQQPEIGAVQGGSGSGDLRFSPLVLGVWLFVARIFV